MKTIKRISFLAAIPVIGLATSCNRTVSFMDAYDYVSKNYDQHMYDYVNAEYEIKLNTAKLDGSATKVTTENKDTHNYNHDLSNFIFNIKDYPAVCITTEALTKIQYYYDSYLGASALSDITGVSFNMNYHLNNGCLGISAGTKNLDKVINIVVGIYNYLGDYLPFGSSTVFTVNSGSHGNGSFEVSAGTNKYGYLNSASLKLNVNYSLGFGVWKGIGTYDKEKKKYSDYVFQSYVETEGSLNLDLSMNAKFN